MADLYTLGNFTIDDIVLHDGRSWMDRPGGNALYAALGAQVWRPGVGLIARLGNNLPSDYLATLYSLELELHLVPVQAPNIHDWALYEPDGSRQIINHRHSGDNDTLSVRGAEIPRTCLNASAFHIASMPAARQADLVATLKGGPPSSRNENLVALDPHELWIQGNQALLFDLVRRVDFFLPSREEARLLYGAEEPEEAVRAFGTMGPHAAVVKLGAEGSLVYDAASGQLAHVPIYPATEVDVTGAGDAYCGGFIAGFLETRDPVLAACYGTVSASFCVENLGVLPVHRPTRAEAQARLEVVRGRVKRD